MSNPSSPPTPSKNGTISLSTYTINDILKLQHPKKVDLYARIISIGIPINHSQNTTYRSICLHDGTNIIWANISKQLLDQYPNDILINNDIVLRNMIVQENEEIVTLTDDIWTSIQSPEIIQLTYFIL